MRRRCGRRWTIKDSNKTTVDAVDIELRQQPFLSVAREMKQQQQQRKKQPKIHVLTDALPGIDLN
jgi:hypothetical protein